VNGKKFLIDVTLRPTEGLERTSRNLREPRGMSKDGEGFISKFTWPIPDALVASSVVAIARD
jgi:hypothetical protein